MMTPSLQYMIRGPVKVYENQVETRMKKRTNKTKTMMATTEGYIEGNT
jgi:hypothetical protein